ncbi:MAG TPA: hypothetical protein VF511_04155 [Chthoniobacterales bacterium]
MKTFPRLLLSTVVLSCGTALAFVALTRHSPQAKSLRLAFENSDALRVSAPARMEPTTRPAAPHVPEGVISPAGPAFGHPIISGVNGVGFEQDLRIDPSNPNRLYTSAPGTLSSDTSWIWRSLDAGRTFKWVPSSVPFNGKSVACAGGGDTELGVDINGHLYFCDLTLANFSTARSDDFGTTFTCSNNGVPDTVVDRQWYAFDGDPTNGGILYLTNDETGPGMPNCPGATVVGNVLVMYRSPAANAPGATGGIEFGPRFAVSGVGTCNEGIMGNNEVSPVATTLGQPNGMGGFATLSTPVKHVFVVHPDAAFHKILMGRCFPVAFGPAVANVSDPSGLNCTDIVIADRGAGIRAGGANFPSMAIDSAGNLYVVWAEAPGTSSSMITGDTTLKFSFSTDQGNTWAPPIAIDTSASPVGTLHTNVLPWIAAGDDGRVGIAWYGTPGAPTFPSRGPDSCPATCDWSLWYVMSTNAHAATPVFTAPVEASQHFVHNGSVQTVLGGQQGDRTLGDFLQLRMGPLGEANISYGDSNHLDRGASHGMFVRQNGGPGLLASAPTVELTGWRPFNSVSDPTNDGRYEFNSMVSDNMPQLDITGSNVSLWTAAPCSAAAPCYKVVMRIANLSLAPTTTEDPDPDLVWLTQWFVPSPTDPNGGKNFHVYAESFNGGALQCFAGENAENRTVPSPGGVALTYPGTITLPAANCQSTLGPNGNITIYVPLSNVTVANPIDNRLHEVTASTMTLPDRGNSVPPEMLPTGAVIGGVFFNVIDMAQSYVFDPAQVTATRVVSRKMHPDPNGTPFDIELAQNGPSATECRTSDLGNTYQLVITFANPISAVAGATVTSGTATVGPISTSGNEVTVNVSGTSDAEVLVLTLNGVNDGTTTGTATITVPILVGDTDGDHRVNIVDTNQTKSHAGELTNANNFRNDSNCDGRINIADTNLVKNHAGNAIAP